MFDIVGFSSPCLGILFSLAITILTVIIKEIIVFSSPCLGILFSQVGLLWLTKNLTDYFRPHAWGFFFHNRKSLNHPFEAAVKFSSPCLGILFSQQAWDAPRGGLSMALLRRGFPIDWNSHYFHPLTYCFLRFHAHRRGFLLL